MYGIASGTGKQPCAAAAAHSVEAAGVDPTPAAFAFKVKKKS